MWNYGFSHAIAQGEIPYVDFNIIAGPLYSFVMSLGLKIWDNYLMFMIEQALLCTLFFALCFKYVGRRGWLLLPLMAFPFFKTFIGTYNFMAMLLLLYLFYLEDSNKNDIYIGVLLGLLIFTKQTIGGVVLILNLLFLRDKGRILKRILGVSLVSILFLIYFLWTGSFLEFIDLCFLGLFDFGNNNGNYINIYVVLSIIIILYIINYYFKNKDIKCSYVIGSFFFAFPIFDYYHFNMFFTIVALFFIKKIEISAKYIRNFSIFLTTLILLFGILLKKDFYKDLEFLEFDRFSYYLVRSNDKKEFSDVFNEYQKYDNAFMIGDCSMLFDVASNKKITYFDVPLKGNYGYNGTRKVIKRVSKMHNVVFFIDFKKFKAYGDREQLDYNLLKFVIDNSKKIDSVGDYNIYYKK